jgi:hypothetical protein
MMRKAIFLLIFVLIFPVVVSAAQGGMTSDEIEKIAESVVLIGVIDNKGDYVASGSGTVVDPEGLILTNRHVVAGGADYAIFLIDNIREEPQLGYYASVVGVSPDIDLALLEIDRDENGRRLRTRDIPNLPALVPNDKTNVGISDDVWVMGYPGIAQGRLVVTQGTITTIENGEVAGKELEALYLTDAEFSPGNSGGLVVDRNGKFIGIPTFVSSEDRTGGRLGGIVSAQAIMTVLNNEDKNLVFLEDWYAMVNEASNTTSGNLVGGYSLDCGNVEFSDGVQFQVVQMRSGFTYTATAIGINGFDPVLAVFDPVTMDGNCENNTRDAAGFEIDLPTTGRVIADRSAAQVQFSQRTGQGLADVSLVVGGADNVAGEFVLLLEGMAVTDFDGFGDPFRVYIYPGMVGYGAPLSIYMFGVANTLDPFLYIHDGDGNVLEDDADNPLQCDDSGDPDTCWGTTDYLGRSFVTRTRGRLLRGDELDSMISFTLGDLADTTVDNPYYYDFAMTSSRGGGDYVLAFHVGTQ